jgi:hypothetical protein
LGKEDNMDVKVYCKDMDMELMVWKAKLYDLMSNVDKLGSSDKPKMLPEVDDLRKIISELGDRLDTLATECPSEWSSEKKEIEDVQSEMRFKYEQTMSKFAKSPPVFVPVSG